MRPFSPVDRHRRINSVGAVDGRMPCAPTNVRSFIASTWLGWRQFAAEVLDAGVYGHRKIVKNASGISARIM
jgi:hypothetical protein